MHSQENNGRKIGFAAFCCLCLFLTVFHLFHGQPNSVPTALLWAFLATEAYPKYKFTSNVAYLLIVIFGILGCIALNKKFEDLFYFE
ncbi:MAG: DUF6442 family protein [Roseburia sp.]